MLLPSGTPLSGRDDPFGKPVDILFSDSVDCIGRNPRRPRGNQAKKIQPEPLTSWTDRGILRDLKDLHHIANPCCDALPAIAFNMAEVTGVPLGRRMELLIGWLNAD
jgi:hypothetical protein